MKMLTLQTVASLVYITYIQKSDASCRERTADAKINTFASGVHLLDSLLYINRLSGSMSVYNRRSQSKSPPRTQSDTERFES